MKIFKSKAVKLALSIMMLFGCQSKNDFEVGSVSTKEISNTDEILLVKEDTITNTGGTFILTNTYDTAMYYDECYEMEILEDENWKEINVIIDFIELSYELNPDSSIEIPLNWENGYGKLISGTYRIIKDIRIENDNYSIAASFTIQ